LSFRVFIIFIGILIVLGIWIFENSGSLAFGYMERLPRRAAMTADHGNNINRGKAVFIFMKNELIQFMGCMRNANRIKRSE